MLKVSNQKIGLSITFTNECIDALMRNRRDNRKPECGGMLFSNPSIDNVIIASSISLPTRFDLSGRFFFKPNKTASQKEIDNKFSQGLTYIGDWHTHPETRPSPSSKDIKTIKSVYKESTHNLNYFLIAIIGTSEKFENNYFALTDGKDIFKLS